MVRLSHQLSSWTSLALVLMQSVSGSLTGSGDVTYNDYEAIPASNRATNPPSCGMPYAQLDLSRITAVEAMDTATDCGKCIKVTNTQDTSKVIYVLAVDTGGRGLDLSKPAFAQLFPLTDGIGAAQWELADSSYCAGIWTTGSSASSSAQNVYSVLSSSVPTPVAYAAQPTTKEPEQPTSSAPSIVYYSTEAEKEVEPSSTEPVYVPPMETTPALTAVIQTTEEELSASVPVYVPPVETAPAPTTGVQATEPSSAAPVSRCIMRPLA